MTKEEIKHFKSLLRHMNILLDDKFQKELLTIIKDYEELQQENQKYKEVIDRIEKYIEKETRIYGLSMSIELGTHFDNILGILKEVE